jgi:nitrite reductase (NO-forming)
VQTTTVPPGGAAITEFRADDPGHYTMVDHAIFRALDKGANGSIEVTGQPNGIFREGTERPCRSVIWGC